MLLEELSPDLHKALSDHCKEVALRSERDYDKLFAFAQGALLRNGMVSSNTLKELRSERWPATKLPHDMDNRLLEKLSCSKPTLDQQGKRGVVQAERATSAHEPVDRLIGGLQEISSTCHTTCPLT